MNYSDWIGENSHLYEKSVYFIMRSQWYERGAKKRSDVILAFKKVNIQWGE